MIIHVQYLDGDLYNVKELSCIIIIIIVIRIILFVKYSCNKNVTIA